jgi:hypothetical protein
MFIAALFMTAKRLKQAKCPASAGQIKQNAAYSYDELICP